MTSSDYYTDAERAQEVCRRVSALLRDRATMRENTSASVRLDVEHFRAAFPPPAEHGQPRPAHAPDKPRLTVDAFVPAARQDLREEILKVAGGPVRFHDTAPMSHLPDLTVDQYRVACERLGVDRVQALLDERGLPEGHVTVNDTVDGLVVLGADPAARQAIATLVNCPVQYRGRSRQIHSFF